MYMLIKASNITSNIYIYFKKIYILCININVDNYRKFKINYNI